MKCIKKVLKNKRGDVTISYLFVIVAALIVGMLVAWWLISIITAATSKPILNVRPVPVVLASASPPRLIAVIENLGRTDLRESVNVWVTFNNQTYGPFTASLNIPAGKTAKMDLSLTGITIPSDVGSIKVVIEYSGGTLEFSAVVSRG
ncbi:MAG: hypothetical protein DRJ52_07975 [Thermoprotei archaeon]|nr:MAG: hypothetical protein DRJ52_07975 [Thermoprotei archaeon]RLE99235.1 MAG: hypothetical protein DRJ63_05940 [Thermoprotei archaeon]